MSIGFSFQSGPCAPEKIRELFLILKNMSKKHDVEFLGSGNFDDAVFIHFCKAGDIVFWYEDGILRGDCQTNAAGPGFHAAAVDFLDVFMVKSKLDVLVDDETDYYSHRDFEKMRREHFYNWLDNLVQAVYEQFQGAEVGNVFICWGPEQYEPIDIPNTVVTPVGRFSMKNLLIRAKEIDTFAGDFFIWNSREKDARFYRNSALSMLWEDCFFMPSRRSPPDKKVNQDILWHLEKAMKMDSSLPFPVAEYLEICNLAGSKPKSVANLAAYESEFPVGYRKSDVHWRLGNLLLPFPGYFLYSKDRDGRDHVYHDNLEKNWYTYRMTALFGPEPQLDFDDDLFEGSAEPPETFPVKDGICRASYSGKVKENGEEYCQIVAEILSGNQVTLITVYFDEPENRVHVMDRLKGVLANVKDDD
ncbi:hypothetical protein [Methanolapillus millepedarum]|uniref:Uncharacterized protein n=1 Tax=Methanolapillus millepedarum TaxID=3028296 RepID=A0AA96ZUA6_9EURY|nr:hypothetical protein MsAc7_10570 [Methanosarcinaceae archaeon Ac7]